MVLWDNIYQQYEQLFPTTGRTYRVIGCDRGWYNIVQNVCKIFAQYQKNNRYSQNNQIEPIQIVQIKEKFGVMRIYIHGADMYTKAIVDFAQTISAETCEYCGKRATINKTKTGWLKTICEECLKIEIDTEKASPY